MFEDLRYGCRRLRTSPGFTVAAVLTLALAIGASTAMFSVLDAVLLRPLPIEAPHRLAMLWTEVPAAGVHEGRSAFWNVEEWRRETRAFVDLAVFDPVSLTMRRQGLEQVGVTRVSPNFFKLIGIAPERGRVFTAKEADDREHLVVISHRFWQARFGGSPSALGAPLELDGIASRVIGVLPEAMRQAGFGADIWQPHTLFPDWQVRRTLAGTGSWFVIGRLRPGATLDQAQADMRDIARRVDNRAPAAGQHRSVGVTPFRRYLTGAKPQLVLWILTGAAVLLLLVAAVNVAGLSLARGVGRVPEMAIRAALGASHWRNVRLLLAESLVVAAAAGVLGLVLAALAIDVIKTLGPENLARLQEVSLDPRVFAWALAASILCGALVGLAPAAAVRRRDLRAAVTEGGRGIAGGVATRLRRLFVVAECAAAMMLLAGAGLLVRSWWNVMQVDPGFQSARVLSISVATPTAMDRDRIASFYQRLLDGVRVLPGVERAGISSELFVGTVADETVSAEGGGTGRQSMQLRRDEIAGALFGALGTPLVRGRDFSAADGQRERVAIVNQTMARRLWGDRDPIGRRFTLAPADPDASTFTVVGVVGDMRRQGLETEPTPQMFEPQAQSPSRRAILFVRSALEDPQPLADPLRATVRRVDPNALVYGVTTVDGRLGELLAQRRVQTVLLSGFSLVALLLTTIGIYGLIRYSVITRTHEIGIRMALGASAPDVFRMVVREGVTLSLVGVLVGLVGAFWLAQLASGLLFGVTGTDPVTYSAVALLLMAVAFAACGIPARRAMHVAPALALQRREI